MAEPYNHRAVEQKWRQKWEENPINVNDGKKPKYYCLDMFPYPSGSGLHVGHWRGYVISDVWSRYKMLQGYYLIHPMGWDAFGLPAENYAIKMGTHPKITTASNIKNIKRQINEIAAIYDWDMEVNTTDPNFYKWTQWIFVKMFKAGLAYEKEMPINWCPSCKTGLANEEVVDGCCERCGSPVTKKNLKHGRHQRYGYGLRSPAHCFLPHGAGLHHRHVFLFLCGGVHRAYHRRSCPLPLFPAGAKAVRLPVRGISDL